MAVGICGAVQTLFFGRGNLINSLFRHQECYSDNFESNLDDSTLKLLECFDQEELNDLIHQLNLYQISSELLASRLRDKKRSVFWDN